MTTSRTFRTCPSASQIDAGSHAALLPPTGRALPHVCGGVAGASTRVTHAR